MKYPRPISINNSLVHGICNYTCRLCSVHLDDFEGPKAFQPREMTEQLIERIREAGREGIYVRYVTNAGDGEPTLHPEFVERMAMFGEMRRTWSAPKIPVPEVAVVTNGSRLSMEGILESICDNGLTLVVSFPSSRPDTYGTIMMGRPERGQGLLDRVLPGIERAMVLRASGHLSKLCFHISPPERDLIRQSFPETLETLTKMASSSGLGELELVLFPTTSNRSGLVGNRLTGMDTYPDYFRQYHGRRINGVTVRLSLVIDRFFQNVREILDVLMRFRFPCLWNANFFITPNGTSICCNDQAARQPLGDLGAAGLGALLKIKEEYRSGSPCVGCDQAPTRLRGSPFAVAYAMGAFVRSFLSV